MIKRNEQNQIERKGSVFNAHYAFLFSTNAAVDAWTTAVDQTSQSILN